MPLSFLEEKYTYYNKNINSQSNQLLWIAVFTNYAEI